MPMVLGWVCYITVYDVMVYRCSYMPMDFRMSLLHYCVSCLDVYICLWILGWVCYVSYLQPCLVEMLSHLKSLNKSPYQVTNYTTYSPLHNLTIRKTKNKKVWQFSRRTWFTNLDKIEQIKLLTWHLKYFIKVLIIPKFLNPKTWNSCSWY